MITLDFTVESAKGFVAPRSKANDVKAVDVIYETSNLDHFKPNPLNRECNKNQVKKILKGIREGKLVCLQVLEVFEPDADGKYVIAEGNTRYQAILLAAEEGIKIPIRFRIIRDAYLKECGMTRIEYVHVINNDRKDWGLKDMVDYYIKDDTDPERQDTYRRLKEFCKEHYMSAGGSISYRYGAALLSNGVVSPSDLKGGNLHIVMSERAATLTKKRIDSVAEAVGVQLKNNFTESFIKAWLVFQQDPDCMAYLSAAGMDKFMAYLKTIRKKVEPIPAVEYWVDIFRKAAEWVYEADNYPI